MAETKHGISKMQAFSHVLANISIVFQQASKMSTIYESGLLHQSALKYGKLNFD